MASRWTTAILVAWTLLAAWSDVAAVQAAEDAPAPSAADVQPAQEAPQPEKVAQPEEAPQAEKVPQTEGAPQPEESGQTDALTPPGPKPDDKLGLGRTGYDSARLLTQSLAAVLVILALGGVAIFVIKRLLPRFGIAQGRRIRVLETVYLGPRRSLHLVRVGDRTLLVGGGREHITLLADLTGSVALDDAAPDAPGHKKARFVVPETAPEDP